MSKSRYATPLMISLTAVGGLALGSAQAGITDLPHGYGLSAEAQAKLQPEGGCGGRSDQKTDNKGHAEGKCGAKNEAGAEKKDNAEGKCGEGKCGEGKCGAKGEAGTEKKDNAEGKCGEGKCGEGGCGGQA